MARIQLDTTGNSAHSTLIAQLNTMLTELYAAGGGGGAVAGTTGTFSGLLTGSSLTVDTGTKTATATGGAATLSKNSGVITSEALTTAAGATYTLTLTNTTIAATDQVFASVMYGTATAGMPVVTRVTPGSGSVVIIVQNIHASAALDGTIKISFLVVQV